jgi:purine-binding chemotaxis protein CheW
MVHPASEAAPRREAGPARLLIFAIGAGQFAIPIQRVVEIVAHLVPTPVPGADPSVEGILPIRGRMVTLVDARRRLGLPPREGPGRASKVIVVDDRGERVGLVVDAVVRVGSDAEGPREALPAALGLARPRLYGGILRLEQGCVLLLELERVLGAEG